MQNAKRILCNKTVASRSIDTVERVERSFKNVLYFDVFELNK